MEEKLITLKLVIEKIKLQMSKTKDFYDINPVGAFCSPP